MTTYTFKKSQVNGHMNIVTIDEDGVYRLYENCIAYEFFGGYNGVKETRVYKKDLPKSFEVACYFSEYDI